MEFEGSSELAKGDQISYSRQLAHLVLRENGLVQTHPLQDRGVRPALPRHDARRGRAGVLHLLRVHDAHPPPLPEGRVGVVVPVKEAAHGRVRGEGRAARHHACVVVCGRISGSFRVKDPISDGVSVGVGDTAMLLVLGARSSHGGSGVTVPASSGNERREGRSPEMPMMARGCTLMVRGLAAAADDDGCCCSTSISAM